MASKSTAGRSVIIVVGVKTLTKTPKYSLLNYGPYALNDANLKTVDLRAIMKNQTSYSSPFTLS